MTVCVTKSRMETIPFWKVVHWGTCCSRLWIPALWFVGIKEFDFEDKHHIYEQLFMEHCQFYGMLWFEKEKIGLL